MMEMIEEEVEVEVVEERQDSWKDGVKWARMYAKTLRWWQERGTVKDVIEAEEKESLKNNGGGGG